MSIAPGTRLGSYEILAPLGAGGMGEVYRARDPRLQREVAIKGLPASFAAHPERLARFEREARLLASLSHPNIAAIFGLVDEGGTAYLVLELIEGESLSQRLARGPLSVRETLEVGGQIAAAIESAHERGIVHRDLKPGNIMLTPGRIVKVLDFGLAKDGAAEEGTAGDLTHSPTVALTATGTGIVLGTAAYMSPEQARGLKVDRRTDVWAFGCVLYECLTGRQTFGGETVSDVIARILEREPDWSALPASAPPRLRELVRRCLTKEPDKRPRDIGDLRLELGAIATESASASVSGVQAAQATPSLAVLYFENVARDPESAYFCTGITEDILTDLSKIKGLRVASRNAVSRYRDVAAPDIAQVASDLGVGAVLEGTVRRAGNRVRITAQLVAGDGFQLWAERYDRTMEDVFAVQEEIASSIAGALKIALSPAETEQLVQNRPQDVRAYDLYLKGRELYGNYNEESLRQALDVFRQATELDPKYALAWAGIADCYGQLCQWGKNVDIADVTRRGIEAARHAIALNPRLPEAYKAEALNLRFQDDREGTRAALLKAVEADPRFLPALINLGVDAFCRADLAGAERFMRRALESDPQEAFGNTWLASLCLFTNRHDESEAGMQKILKLSRTPFYLTAYYALTAMSLLSRGDVRGAEARLQEGRTTGARPDDLKALEARLAARTGHPDRARELVHELESLVGLTGSGITLAAAAAIAVGEHEIAVRFMNRELTRDLAPTWVRLVHDLHPLLDRAPFAPRRSDMTLVWPLEAPMVDRARFELFKEVRIDTGLPEGSDIR